MHRLLVLGGFLALLSNCKVSGQPVSGTECTTESTQPEEYQTLCSHPKVAQDIDFKWISSHSAVWYMEIGTEVARLHLAEVMKGKLLTYDDDFSDMCGVARILHGASEADGKFFGFGNATASWKCVYSQEDQGVLLCDLGSTSGLSKYKDKAKMYVSYTDNESLLVFVVCFPNGEIGWAAGSSKPTLHDEGREQVLAHVKDVGFDPKDAITIYDAESCPERDYS